MVEDIDVFQSDKELQPSKITYKDNRRDGTRVWTIVLSDGISKNFTGFNLVGIGENGIQGEAYDLPRYDGFRKVY
jgi:hypothetical protein